MKKRSYRFACVAEWVINSVKRNLEFNFPLTIEVKNPDREMVGELVLEADDETILEKAERFISTHPIFRLHFVPTY